MAVEKGKIDFPCYFYANIIKLHPLFYILPVQKWRKALSIFKLQSMFVYIPFSVEIKMADTESVEVSADKIETNLSENNDNLPSNPSASDLNLNDAPPIDPSTEEKKIKSK